MTIRTDICAFGDLVCGEPIGVYLVLVILAFLAALIAMPLIIALIIYLRDDAQGGEAGTAETGTGSVHEHPVGKADAP